MVRRDRDLRSADPGLGETGKRLGQSEGEGRMFLITRRAPGVFSGLAMWSGSEFGAKGHVVTMSLRMAEGIVFIGCV